MLRCCTTLLAVLAALPAGESLVLEAPGSSVQLGAGGTVTVAGQGFVARKGDWLLTGEALRWDQRRDSLWASGGIVMVMPGVRLHAARIGLRPEARTGDAWEVEAWIERGDVRLRVQAERVELRHDRLTFREVRGDFGHGGVLALSCPALHVYLREEPAKDRAEGNPGRYVEGLAAVRPTVSLGEVPVFWFPYLYRDFVIDYPWTKIEVGESERLGSFLHFTIGTGLPEVAGWHTRIEGRADRNTRAGNGFGAELFWRHEDFGRGGASVYRMIRERVADPADQGIEGGTRDVNSWDAEHYLSGRGWAAAARYTVLPDADPSQTLPDGRSPDERFRADHQQKNLEEKPFARQGLAGAWTTPWLSFAADGERRPNDDLDETERLLGAEIGLPQLSLLGPLYADGRLRVERLRQEVRDNEANRATWEGRLAAVQWLGGLGFDAAGGLRGVAWSDGRLAGVETGGSSGTSLPFGEAGVRLRLAQMRETGSVVLSPRLGVEWLGEERGRGNPGFAFGDGLDDPESDRQYGVTSLDAEAHLGGMWFSADVTARWGLRPVDREAVEVGGGVRSSDALADLGFSVRGSPHRDVLAVADGVYDARLARWTEFDARARWQVQERVELLYNGAYVPPTATTTDAWLHRVGGSLLLNRYRLDLWGELRPGDAVRPDGRSIDLWHVGAARRMVDGLATIAYENAYDPTQDGIDQRITASFSVGATQQDMAEPARRAFGF